MVVFVFSCNEDLSEINPKQENSSETFTSFNPLNDSVSILVALTPVDGPNAEILMKSNLINTKNVTNYNQKLPANADVLYINTMHNWSRIPESKIFNDALIRSHTRILIDGTPESIEDFCKHNFPIFETLNVKSASSYKPYPSK